MKKSPRTIIPTRFLPRGSRRITTEGGSRAWLIGGKIFPSKRAYFDWLEEQKHSAVQQSAAKEAQDASE